MTVPIARRKFVVALAGAAAAWPLAARAQQGNRVRRIGVLARGVENDRRSKPGLSAFTQALAGLGWADGRNVRMDLRWFGDDNNRIRALARELVGLQPDIILANGTAATAALQRETRTIPIVFATTSDPVVRGIVARLNQPGLALALSCGVRARLGREQVTRPSIEIVHRAEHGGERAVGLAAGRLDSRERGERAPVNTALRAAARIARRSRKEPAILLSRIIYTHAVHSSRVAPFGVSRKRSESRTRPWPLGRDAALGPRVQAAAGGASSSEGSGGCDEGCGPRSPRPGQRGETESRTRLPGFANGGLLP
jgi:hypothetical protein